MNAKVDFYFNKAGKWQEELEQLRTIALDCQLTEELKWGTPCYMHQKSNIVLIHDFKEYCAFLFFKGALLKDPEEILIQQSKNVQAARQIRFTNLKEITAHKSILKAYIYEAIEIEKAGLKVELKKTSEFPVSDEFQKKLDESVNYKAALSPQEKREEKKEDRKERREQRKEERKAKREAKREAHNRSK